VLGNPIDVVINTEDRELLTNRLNEIDEKIFEAYAVENIEDAVKAAKILCIN